MYHVHYKGTHYEAGFRWGSLLFRHQNIILENIPFEITPERMDYSRSCLPVYQKYYPEILEEIRGLADAQHCDTGILQAVLLSMYAIPPACCCSCFAVTDGNTILLGRNSDFLTDLEKLNMNAIYRLSDGAYAFTGNTTAFVEIEDGINEYGLAIGLTSVFPVVRKPGFNAGLLLRYLLEKCRTVPEAISCIEKLPIGSAQTLTLADSGGKIAVVECCAERTEISCTGFVCATNRFHLPQMEPYNLPDTAKSDLSQMKTKSGNLSEIDDWFAQIRYETLQSALTDKASVPGLSFARGLLSGEYGFLCQYDRSTGKDTVWSVIYDPKHRRIYRCEKNPGRGKFTEDLRFKFI